MSTEIQTKTCIKCGVTKSRSEFYLRKTSKDGLRSDCKDCFNIRCASYRANNKTKIANRNKEYRKRNKESIQKYKHEYYLKNIEQEKMRSKRHREKNKDHYKEYNKQYRKNNNDYLKKCNKMYYESNKEIIAEKQRTYMKVRGNSLRRHNHQKRMQTDINYRLLVIMRGRIKTAIKSQYSSKACKSTNLLGCTIQECREHLESQFKEGMTWENHGTHGWHIDHIRPCASFDLTDPEQQKQCFHYTNLQPLWADENLEKSDKWNCRE